MPTKIFISWSGDLSNKLAEAVRNWIPGVLQFAKPYFTPSDIEKGTRWGSDILGELGASDIGIICLTKENLTKPWILFEAGALSTKNFDKSRVCTLLFGVESTDLKGPLTIFQGTRFEKADVKKLVKTINSTGGDAKLEDSVLDEVFEMWWPRLQERVAKILEEAKSDSANSQRPERDILEEILELSRLSTRRRERDFSPEVLMELVEMTSDLQMAARRGDPERLSMLAERLERPLHNILRGLGEPELFHRFVMRRRMIEEDPKRSAKSEP
jgi:hypothetical protein